MAFHQKNDHRAPALRAPSGGVAFPAGSIDHRRSHGTGDPKRFRFLRVVPGRFGTFRDEQGRLRRQCSLANLLGFLGVAWWSRAAHEGVSNPVGLGLETYTLTIDRGRAVLSQFSLPARSPSKV